MLCCAVITGEKQGLIEGSCDLEDLAGTIEIEAFDHMVEIPRGRAGLPTGRRVHQDISVSKEVDKSTPKLYKALCDGERLTTVEFKWYKPVSSPRLRENFYSVRLTHAVVTRVKPWMPHRLDPSRDFFKLMEDVSFAYEKIEWSWKPDNIEHEDSWIAPDA